MLVVEVDAIGVEALEGAFDRDADVRRAAVGSVAARVRHEPELRGQHDLVAPALDRPSDELLIRVGSVHLGGVDEGHAEVERPVDGADGLRVVRAGPGVGGGHAHGAETDTGDVEVSEADVLHARLLLL